MGTTDILRQSHPGSLPLVAFDFDGTLTWRDSFVAFLAWRAGPWGFAVGRARLAPSILAYAVHRDRGRLKAAFARQFLGRIGRDRLEADARRFAAARSDALMRPDALSCWRDWRRRGARLFIVTASPDILVAPFASLLGADGLIGTRLLFDSDGRFAGALDGTNCRGVEKVVRLRALLGAETTLKAAYGDSDGDREMLALAEIPGLKVFTDRP
jgi:phosphatidylglycerophosphatase C